MPPFHLEKLPAPPTLNFADMHFLDKLVKLEDVGQEVRRICPIKATRTVTCMNGDAKIIAAALLYVFIM